jgi:hypothetical protein
MINWNRCLRQLGFISVTLFTAIGTNAQQSNAEFTSPITVSDHIGENIFHHLESSGRKNIAVNHSHAAVVWEDNRNGSPGVYVSFKALDQPEFSPSVLISGASDAYEPSIIAINQFFLIAWEEQEKVHLRLISAKTPGKTIAIDSSSAQPSISSNHNSVLLTYTENKLPYSRIKLMKFQLDKNQLLPTNVECYIDSEPATADQSYATSAVNNDSLVIAWEDRRPGHTIIMGSLSHSETPCQRTSPFRISDKPIRASTTNNSMNYGTGHGVSRVALAAHGKQSITAIWADKRDFREGYDIYAAQLDAEKKQFMTNVKVQDDFGSVAQQWHATIAGHPSGALIAAWDDNRDGSADIYYSYFRENVWSEDYPLPGASSSVIENHPSLIFDHQGYLHIAWVERKDTGSSTQIRYLTNRP